MTSYCCYDVTVATALASEWIAVYPGGGGGVYHRERQRHESCRGTSSNAASDSKRLHRCCQLPNKFSYYTRLMTLYPGLHRWAGTRKVKPIWILLKQETVCGSGIGRAICKFAPRSRQTTTPVPHHSVFYRPYASPAAQPTASKHWRYIWSKSTSIDSLGEQVINIK